MRSGCGRPGQLRVVVAHHPVRAKVESDVHNLLFGRERALAAWTRAGVDLILGGHIHLPYVMPILADRPTAGWVAQAGTTCSWRVRGKVPNSVNLIVRDEADGVAACHVERWDYAGTHAFEPVDKTGWIWLVQARRPSAGCQARGFLFSHFPT